MVTAKYRSYHKIVQWGTYRIRLVHVPRIFGSCIFHFQKKLISCRADRVGSEYLKYTDNTKSFVGQNFLNTPSLGGVYAIIFEAALSRFVSRVKPQRMGKVPVWPIICTGCLPPPKKNKKLAPFLYSLTEMSSVLNATIKNKTTSVTTHFKKLTTGNNVFILSVIA